MANTTRKTKAVATRAQSNRGASANSAKAGRTTVHLKASYPGQDLQPAIAATLKQARTGNFPFSPKADPKPRSILKLRDNHDEGVPDLPDPSVALLDNSTPSNLECRIDELNSAICEHRQLLRILEERLAPILTPHFVPETAAGEECAEYSPMAQKIANSTGHVELQNRTLTRIINMLSC